MGTDWRKKIPKTVLVLHFHFQFHFLFFWMKMESEMSSLLLSSSDIFAGFVNVMGGVF